MTSLARSVEYEARDDDLDVGVGEQKSAPASEAQLALDALDDCAEASWQPLANLLKSRAKFEREQRQPKLNIIDASTAVTEAFSSEPLQNVHATCTSSRTNMMANSGIGALWRRLTSS